MNIDTPEIRALMPTGPRCNTRCPECHGGCTAMIEVEEELLARAQAEADMLLDSRAGASAVGALLLDTPFPTEARHRIAAVLVVGARAGGAMSSFIRPALIDALTPDALRRILAEDARC